MNGDNSNIENVERVTTGSYLDKSPDSARMGKAAELLVASFCILATRGELNVSTSIVDDEGVDLVFHRRGSSATLAVQVKARMSDTKGVMAGTFIAQVRQTTFRPRHDLDLLFVAIDIEAGSISEAWLVPSAQFLTIAGSPNGRGVYRFTASMKPTSHDRWSLYRLDASRLPIAILNRLAQLEVSGR